MLIILEHSYTRNEFIDTLAININNHDSIVVYKVKESNDKDAYCLGVQKFHDGKFSNDSETYYIFAGFHSKDDCLILFEKIISAIRSGKQIYDLRSEKDGESKPIEGYDGYGVIGTRIPVSSDSNFEK